MEKQNSQKRQLRGSSSLCTSEKKKPAERQSCPQSSAGRDESQLPVTCGYKKGFLDLKKYNNNQECIFSEGQWFKPTEFERFGMMDRNKKWKTSILSNGIPLQKLIEDGFITSKTFMKSKVQDIQKKETPVGLEQQESDEKENQDDDDDDDDDYGDDDDDDDDDDGDDGIDMSVFERPTLPITCGSGSGTLHKSRFVTGRCGRCIRTENSWLSPGDFIRLNKPDGTWRKDIVAHGMPLGKLITKRVLEPHKVNCDQEDRNDDVCFVCDSEGDLVCCDECPRAFHSHCHQPAVDEDSPGSQWSCTFCVIKNMEDSSRKTQQDVLSSPVSQYTLHCQCLLLQLLHESMIDPCTNVPRYSENICGPMMLGRVKLNLENNDYQTVQKFVSDIEYVFHQWTSNRDNEFRRMTSRLKELFETIFRLL